MTIAVTEQTVDLEALARDAEARLAELRPQVQRLALDALNDPRIASELDDVRSEIASAERAVEQVQLAHTEKGRRASEAAEKAALQARERAMEQAQALQSDRERGAAAVDGALSELARQVSAWLATCDEQAAALQAAGRRPAQRAARDRSLALDAAFIDAMRLVPRGILQLDVGGWPPRGRPLVEGDHRPVQTIEKGCGNDGND